MLRQRKGRAPLPSRHVTTVIWSRDIMGQRGVWGELLGVVVVGGILYDNDDADVTP